MIDNIYTRSIASTGNRYFSRLIALSLSSVFVLLFAFFNLSIKEVVSATGQVYPEKTAKIYAQDDMWVKLNQELAGARVQDGEAIGTVRYRMNSAEATYQIELKQEQIKLFTLQKEGLEFQKGEAQVENRIRTLDQEIAILQREVAQIEKELQPDVLKATLSGEIRSVHADTSDFTFFRKGELVAEIFSPDTLIVRATIPPYQAQQLDTTSLVFVENRRTNSTLPGRIVRTFYDDAGAKDGAQVTVDIRAEHLSDFKIGMDLDVRIVTAERKLFDILRDVFVR